jgi:hypothetical protein
MLPFWEVIGKKKLDIFLNSCKCIDVPNGSTARSGHAPPATRTSSQIEWNGTGKCLDLTDI